MIQITIQIYENNSITQKQLKFFDISELSNHGLLMPGEEIAFTARPKINSHSQSFRYGGSIFCLPHRPKFSDFFDLCLHWVSVVRVSNEWNWELSFLINLNPIPENLTSKVIFYKRSVRWHHSTATTNFVIAFTSGKSAFQRCFQDTIGTNPFRILLEFLHL